MPHQRQERLVLNHWNAWITSSILSPTSKSKILSLCLTKLSINQQVIFVMRNKTWYMNLVIVYLVHIFALLHRSRNWGGGDLSPPPFLICFRRTVNTKYYKLTSKCGIINVCKISWHIKFSNRCFYNEK